MASKKTKSSRARIAGRQHVKRMQKHSESRAHQEFMTKSPAERASVIKDYLKKKTAVAKAGITKLFNRKKMG